MEVEAERRPPPLEKRRAMVVEFQVESIEPTDPLQEHRVEVGRPSRGRAHAVDVARGVLVEFG